MSDPISITTALREGYEEQMTDKDRLDFLAFHMRTIAGTLDLIERKIEAIGQSVTNTEAFTTEVRQIAEGMRSNPMFRMMGGGKMNLPPIPGIPG